MLYFLLIVESIKSHGDHGEDAHKVVRRVLSALNEQAAAAVQESMKDMAGKQADSAPSGLEHGMCVCVRACVCSCVHICVSVPACPLFIDLLY